MIPLLLALMVATVPPTSTPIADAVAGCLGFDTGFNGVLEVDDADVLDDGHSLVLDGVRVFDFYDCVATDLGLPEWVRALMNRTAGVGLVTVELDRYTVMWVFGDGGPAVVLHD